MVGYGWTDDGSSINGYYVTTENFTLYYNMKENFFTWNLDKYHNYAFYSRNTQENWETLMDRVENGETIGVENENGDRIVMVPPI